MNELAGIKVYECEPDECALCLALPVEENGSHTGKVNLCTEHVAKMRVAIEEINRERGVQP